MTTPKRGHETGGDKEEMAKNLPKTVQVTPELSQGRYQEKDDGQQVEKRKPRGSGGTQKLERGLPGRRKEDVDERKTCECWGIALGGARNMEIEVGGNNDPYTPIMAGRGPENGSSITVGEGRLQG